MTNSEYNNGKLVYEYTKTMWDRTVSSYNLITTKLTTGLGFSGVLLRFAVDLPDKSWLAYLKIAICVLLSFSIVVCLIGLYPVRTGVGMAKPDMFLDDDKGDVYGLDEERSYVLLAKGLNASIKDLEKTRDTRAMYLSITTYLLGISLLGFALSIVGKTV